jgi:hypothetical protein
MEESLVRDDGADRGAEGMNEGEAQKLVCLRLQIEQSP